MVTRGKRLFTFLGPVLVDALPKNCKFRVHNRRFLCSSAVRAPGTTVQLPTFRHTEALGRLLGESVMPGSVVLLYGELGAGKTSFARGFVRAAVNDPTIEVTSPTFLLANEYPVTSDAGEEEFKIVHMDLWRLKDSSSRPIVDFEDVFKNHVAVIEWPDRLGELAPDQRLDVFLEYVDVPVTEDNPWGFADHDPPPGEEGDSTAGATSADERRATLFPRSDFWESKIQSISAKLQGLEDETIPEELLS